MWSAKPIDRLTQGKHHLLPGTHHLLLFEMWLGGPQSQSRRFRGNIFCLSRESSNDRGGCSLSLYRLSVPGSKVPFINYEARHCSRRHQLCSRSIIPQHFMKPKVSFPCSQKLCTFIYPELDQSSPHHPHPICNRLILILSIHLRLSQTVLQNS
jgi:hypothetical protein